jgi:membrane protease YdiL (CAAX protease family)
MLRGPRHRWWRPVLSLLLAALFAVVSINLLTIPLALAGIAAGVSDPIGWVTQQISATTNLGPVGFLYVNLSLIVLIPCTTLAIWIAHRIRPRYVSSVQGGLRWKWLLRCLLVVLPLWGIYLGLSAGLEPAASPRPDQWLILLAIVIFLTPLQAAGEEYFFRGLITQSVGSWFSNPIVAFVVPTVIATGAFAAAHGSSDIWVFASLAVFGLTASILTWRTGGLEAAIAIHAVNNVGVFFTVLLVGGWNEAFVSESSEGTPWQVLIALVVHGIALALILWQARRSGIKREYQPEVSAA